MNLKKVMIANLFRNRIAQVFRNKNLKRAFYISAGLTLLSTFLLSMNLVGHVYNYRIGDIATENIRVPSDIVYEVEYESDLERQRAAEASPLVFDRDSFVLQEKLKLVNAFFFHLANTLRSYPFFDKDDAYFQLKDLHKRLPDYLRYEDGILRAFLAAKNPEELRIIVVQILNEIYNDGILDAPYDNPLKISNTSVVIRTTDENMSYKVERRKLEELKTLEELNRVLNVICQKYTAGLSPDQQWAVYIVVKSLTEDNMRFNPEETKNRIEQSRQSANPVMAIMKKGQILIREGDSITSDSLSQIDVLNRYTGRVHLNYIIGIFLLQITFLVVIFVLLHGFLGSLVPDRNAPVLSAMLLVFYFLYSFFVLRTGHFDEQRLIFSLYLPLPFIVMTVTILYNIQVAMLVSLCAVFFSTALMGGDFNSLLISLAQCMLAMFATENMEKRTDFLKRGFLFSVVNSLLVISIGLFDEFSFGNILDNIEVAFISGFGNTIAAMGIFPLFEHLFSMTTKFKLLEISDLNAPILKKMLIKAPGTYNHSIMVANMAEAACKEINSNYLLARVGGYYHDIGKIDEARIFIENKGSPVPIPQMSPQEYSKKIIDHVTRGVETARKHGLPQSVIDFIQEHHGSSVMTFFYHQALEEATNNNNPESVSKADFTYPGPKPHSREIAIVMLADAIEAASRSLQEPSYVKLETLVKKIIYNKLNEGELDNSDLTMQDLNRIQQAFLRVLNGIFHTRLEYPEKDEIKKLENQIKQGNEHN